MKKQVPSSLQISETVAMFLVQVSEGEISPKKRKDMTELALAMWGRSDIVYDLKKIHAKICSCEVCAGEYRQSLVLDNNARTRFYPKSCELEVLMDQYFYHAYALALRKDEFAEHLLKDVAWYVGAFGKCIKPFYQENRSIFWLVENQIRMRHGLLPTADFRPKNNFDQFRRMQFSKAFAWSYSDR